MSGSGKTRRLFRPKTRPAGVTPSASLPQVTPATLGVELSGTLVGPHRRVALIGGKAYREGQTITVDQNDQPIQFELVEVHPQRIVLNLQGTRFDLAIPERRSSGLIGPSGN